MLWPEGKYFVCLRRLWMDFCIGEKIWDTTSSQWMYDVDNVFGESFNPSIVFIQKFEAVSSGICLCVTAEYIKITKYAFEK